MISVTSVVIATVCLALAYKFLYKRKTYSGKLPPGPNGIPFLGSLLSISFQPHIRFGEWVKIYGNIFSVKLANYNFVVISDHKVAKDAYNNTALLGKPDFPLFNIMSGGNYGILASHGPVWQEQRRFMLRNLRDFGFGKSTMHTLAVEEVKDFVSWLKSQEGKSIALHRKFSLAVINSLWTIMTGKRFAQDDAQVSGFLESTNKVLTDLLSSPVAMFFPALAQALPKVFGWDKLLEVVEQNKKFVREPVEEHRNVFSSEETPRDFIDSYLLEIEKTTDSKSSFYKATGQQSLEVVILDLFGAGSETTSTTLTWAFLYLCKYPEVQAKLQQELDAVVGKSRLPSLEDRPKLPYTEAIILETLRKSSILTFGVFHAAMEDTNLNGYFIPKDTWIIINQYFVHHNPQVWGDPEKFRPERFLSDDGKTVLKNEALMAFSVGKRQCVGEQIAKDGMFLFLTAVFQRFAIKFDPKEPEPPLESSKTFFLNANNYNVIMKDRIV